MVPDSDRLQCRAKERGGAHDALLIERRGGNSLFLLLYIPFWTGQTIKMSISFATSSLGQLLASCLAAALAKMLNTESWVNIDLPRISLPRPMPRLFASCYDPSSLPHRPSISSASAAHRRQFRVGKRELEECQVQRRAQPALLPFQERDLKL